MNENSLHGFKKLGWSVQPIFYRKIFLKRKNSRKFHTLYKNNFPKEIEKFIKYLIEDESQMSIKYTIR